MRLPGKVMLGLALALCAGTSLRPASGQTPETTPLPSFLKDRGTGVSTSQFATYVRRGELIIYPFFEHDRHNKFEYKPSEFGAVGEQDFRGRYRASEQLIFLAYGVTDNLAVELEVAKIRASLKKSPADTSTVPAEIKESGLGDVEAHVRWRWLQETKKRPEFFSFAEVVFPHNKRKNLIGTSGVELKAGTGFIRGFKWGTISARAAVEYSAGSLSKFDLGEYAVEYIKQVSPKWRFYVGLEGRQDELSLITEAQWHIKKNIFLKFNNGVGLTSRATTLAPEVGVVFTLPIKR